MTTHRQNDERDERAAHERVVFLDRLLVFGLIIAGVVLSALGDHQHATMMLGGALGAIAPLAARSPSTVARIMPLALGLGVMTLAGCGASSAATAFKVTAAACDVAVPVCSTIDAACHAVSSSGSEAAR